jgi:hypothetical protein
VVVRRIKNVAGKGTSSVRKQGEEETLVLCFDLDSRSHQASCVDKIRKKGEKGTALYIGVGLTGGSTTSTDSKA